MRTCALIVASLLSCIAAAADDTEVVTLAGVGERRSFGDGRPAIEAGVAEPYGLEVGPDGALYVCETVGHVIRRIDLQTGRISTAVGTGESGNDGDGGPATAARIDQPYEVRFDADGNLFFVDMTNHTVRRVDASTRTISTVAGNGTEGFSGDRGPASLAQLNHPHSICLDGSGRLYICDIGNHRIRVVDLRSGTIDSFGGTGERAATPDGAPLAGTPLNGPRALAFDGQHSLYLVLREGNMVYRIDLDSRTLHHIGGTGQKGHAGDGGDARQAEFRGPKGIALGPGGDIFVADTQNHAIRVIRQATAVVEAVIGDGVEGDGPDGAPLRCRLDDPHGVCVGPDGTVYVGDSENHRVRMLRP
jgi:DNA-binding beta-propeller fold protein YncE